MRSVSWLSVKSIHFFSCYLRADFLREYRVSASRRVWITGVIFRSQCSVIVLWHSCSWSLPAERKVLHHAGQQTDTLHVGVLVSSQRSTPWSQQEVRRAAALSPASAILFITQCVLPGREQGDCTHGTPNDFLIKLIVLPVGAVTFGTQIKSTNYCVCNERTRTWEC